MAERTHNLSEGRQVIFQAEDKTVIYDAAFQFDGMLRVVDMLVKREVSCYVYPMNSKTKLKSPFLKIM